MPLMTEPLAHLEMLESDTRAKIEGLNIERIKIEAKMAVLNDLRWEISKALDEEKKKRSDAAGGEPK